MNSTSLKPSKPCPFCGSEAIFVWGEKDASYKTISTDFKICCKKCGAKIQKKYEIEILLKSDGTIEFLKDERDSAVSDWNVRK